MPPEAQPSIEKNPLVQKFAEFDKTTFADKSTETAAAREIAAYVLRLQVEQELEPIRVELGALRKQVESQMAQQPTVDMSRYVDVADIALVGGKLASLMSILGILIYALTGFAMIHPVVAIFVLIGGAAFYSMGRITQTRHAQAK